MRKLAMTYPEIPIRKSIPISRTEVKGILKVSGKTGGTSEKASPPIIKKPVHKVSPQKATISVISMPDKPQAEYNRSELIHRL